MFGVEPLTPAYGKKYASLSEVQKDFDNDKDFSTPLGHYTNRSDLLRTGRYAEGSKLSVRYGPRLQKVGTVSIRNVTEQEQ